MTILSAPEAPSQPEIFSGLFARGGAAAEVEDRAWVRAMVQFEVALAASLAELGLAPEAEAAEIAAECEAEEVDLADLARGSAAAGTPVPALLAQLRERLSAPAQGLLHRGATSQDVVDTATMLVARRALVPLLADLDAAAAAAAALAERHRDALEPGRTLLQQALPITFGLKAAGWLVALDESAARLTAVRERVLAVQLGGAAGTLASLGEDGVAVAAALASRLDLAEPTTPWHSIRLRPVELAAALGAAAGVAGKVGTDLVLLAQTEVGEVAEAAAGGSSTMPHKHNPVAAVAAVACSKRTPGLVATMLAAMPGEHERAAGAWQAEAETLAELLRLAGSAAAAIRAALVGLEVDEERMRANLDLTAGLLMSEALATALGERLGREPAQELVAEASRLARESGRTLAEAAAEVEAIVAALGAEGIERTLDPGAYLGSASPLIDRALAAHRERAAGR